MLCQCCGKNPATNRIKKIADGELIEYAICAECAQQFGCGNVFTGLGYQFSDIVKEYFTSSPNADRCRFCGMSFSDIVRSGHVGCAECYRTFNNRLMPIIRQIHGSDVHCGKSPNGDLPQVRVSGKLAVRKKRNGSSSDGGSQNGNGT